MKIKDLDRNEVYDLTEIKKDSLKFYLLKEWLEKNCHKWDEFKSMRLHKWDSLKYNLTYEMWYMSNGEPTKCALTLLELDITDYQVDCMELNEEQIEEMCNVMLSKGEKYLTSKEFALNRNHTSDFLISSYELFYITNKQQKTTITYDKFMELFGEKKPIEQVVEELAEAFEEKPSQYQIGIDTFTRTEANNEVFNPQKHYDNSNGSLYKLAEELHLNHWEFDILKRLVRCRKKGNFIEDLNKIKDTINIYISEY